MSSASHPRSRHLWTDVPLTGPGMMRKLERRLALSGEYGIKAVYATLIGAATASAYTPDALSRFLVVAGWDDSIAVGAGAADSSGGRLHRVRWLDRHYALLRVSRYTPYRDALLALARRPDRLRVAEIAGNRVVTLHGDGSEGLAAPRSLHRGHGVCVANGARNDARADRGRRARPVDGAFRRRYAWVCRRPYLRLLNRSS